MGSVRSLSQFRDYLWKCKDEEASTRNNRSCCLNWFWFWVSPLLWLHEDDISFLFYSSVWVEISFHVSLVSTKIYRRLQKTTAQYAAWLRYWFLWKQNLERTPSVCYPLHKMGANPEPLRRSKQTTLLRSQACDDDSCRGPLWTISFCPHSHPGVDTSLFHLMEKLLKLPFGLHGSHHWISITKCYESASVTKFNSESSV